MFSIKEKELTVYVNHLLQKELTLYVNHQKIILLKKFTNWRLWVYFYLVNDVTKLILYSF